MDTGLTIRPYDRAQQHAWDSFVSGSKNGTFLFLRDYMDYHGDRFADCSLLVLDRERVAALLPANRAGDDIHSHAGLTYGGLITDHKMTTPHLVDIFAAVTRHLRDSGARRLFYKTIPSIYHRVPAEEDRYALFLADAVLHRRDVLSVVTRSSAIAPQTRRRRSEAKAVRLDVTVEQSGDWAEFWSLLSDNLMSRHRAAPVHSLSEIIKLRGRFPDNIHLHVARLQGAMVAGAVVYESEMVAHVQYIAASDIGRQAGALDKLLFGMLNEVYASKAYFDFGISNEGQGRTLNRGLIEQKEGFGARAIVHDFYVLTL